MKIDTYACDVCNTQKKETNHWFKAKVYEDVHMKLRTRSIQITQWDTNYPEHSDSKHFCGIPCALKWIGKELQSLSENSPTKYDAALETASA